MKVRSVVPSKAGAISNLARFKGAASHFVGVWDPQMFLPFALEGAGEELL